MKLFLFFQVVAYKTLICLANDTFVIFNSYMRDVIMKRKYLSYDGQLFHQYKENTSHLKITDYNKDHDI